MSTRPARRAPRSPCKRTWTTRRARWPGSERLSRAPPSHRSRRSSRASSTAWFRCRGNGALDGAVRRLGETIGYHTAVTGKAPQAGVNVAVDPAPRRVYDILHGLGDQAGDDATVRIDQQHQLLEVIYHG